MLQTVTTIGRWVTLPGLLTASIFWRYAGRYEVMVDVAVCLCAVVFVQKAIQSDHYLWAAGFVTIAIVFSPLLLAVKIFLLLGLTCGATWVTLFAALRQQPAEAR